jgi:peptide/nickel transport system substrate-binding protein
MSGLREADGPGTSGQAAEQPFIMGRRAALRLLGSGVGTAVLVACGPPAPEARPTIAPAAASAPTSDRAAAPTTTAATPTAPAAPATVVRVAPTTAAATQSAGQPRMGGTLRVGMTADIPNLDGAMRSPASSDSVWQIYEGLTQYDAKLQPQPKLAVSWEVDPAFKEFKFNLRKGVLWHSGREFTSDDVKWNLLRVRDPKVGSGSLVTWANWFTTIDTPDKNTIVLKSELSRPAAFDFFEWFNLTDRVTMEGPDAKLKSIGTGPFVLVDWVQGDHLAMTRNNNYWQSGRPYLDGITALVRNPQAAIIQFEAGEIDLMRTAALTDIARIKADPKYQVVTHPSPGAYYHVGYNVAIPPFDNKLVRQALNYAMDRKRFVENSMFGLAKPLVLPWSPNSPAFDPAKNELYAFDLDKASELLKEAGVSGLESDLLLIPGVYPPHGDFAQLFAADLEKIGVKMNIKVMDLAPFIDVVNNLRYNAVYISADSQANLSPDTLVSAAPGLSVSKNNSGYKSEAYTSVVDAISTEIDPVKRQQAITSLNDFLLDEAFDLPFSENPLIMLAQSGVKGLAPMPGRSMFLYTETWLDV